MLITEVKPVNDILSLVNGNTAVISCEGCKEVYFPETEAAETQKMLAENNMITCSVITDYICNPDNLMLQLKKHMNTLDASGTILVFSCGVGVQTVAEAFPDKNVCAACNTYPLPGHQGVTPLEYDCAQCGDCYLNSTGGICPITACSKSLVNGQCGGMKNGKCEVDADMECGWERIYRRLEKLNHHETQDNTVSIRNYATERSI